MKHKTRDEMREHIISLCKANDITISWCERSHQAHAMREFDEVCIPATKSEISYAVALHEIGHVLGKYQHSEQVMVRERWAWKWAKKNALVWTVGMTRMAKSSLSWYGVRH
jgi:hypothetical protein